MDISTNPAQVGRSSPFSPISSTESAQRPDRPPRTGSFEPALFRSLQTSGPPAEDRTALRLDAAHSASSAVPQADAGGPQFSALVLDGEPSLASTLAEFATAISSSDLDDQNELPLPADLAQSFVPIKSRSTKGANISEAVPPDVSTELLVELLQELAFDRSSTSSTEPQLPPVSIDADVAIPLLEIIAADAAGRWESNAAVTSHPSQPSNLSAAGTVANTNPTRTGPIQADAPFAVPQFLAAELRLDSGLASAKPLAAGTVAGTGLTVAQKAPAANLPASFTSIAPAPATSSSADQSDGVETPPVPGRGPGSTPGAVTPSASTRAGSTPQPLHADAPEFANRLSNALVEAHRSGRPLRVRLHPPELGSLAIEVGARDGQVSARLNVETAEAHRALLEHLPQLREVLVHGGHSVDRIEVTLDETPGDDRQAEHRDSREESSGDRPRQDRRPPSDEGQPSDTEGKPETVRRTGSALDQLDLEI